MTIGRNLLLSSCALVALTSLPATACAQEQQVLEDLRGQWKFHLGDDSTWASPSCNDEKWDDIYAPSAWENEGYPGYDGYAWYRKTFYAKEEWRGKALRLHLGTIDDADETYVNGVFIGFGGQLPPHYITEYAWTRDYLLPSWCVKFGETNVVAVRVYDGGLAGGITGGRLGIYALKDPLQADQSLAGKWKIKVGDDPEWKDPAYHDKSWREAVVPIYWETQGMKDYDGFAWYRCHFRPDPSLDGKTLIFLAGKVDDLDETYLNGERIGRTGSMEPRNGKIHWSNEYSQLRAYTIPAGLLKFGEDNVVAVRVYDGWLHGGMYDGPVGLISRDAYLEWKSHHRDHYDFWEFLRRMFDN
ncbi:MAG TPA: beta galactosidase jelly roll domain-containing protein [Bacteroidota bacterium]|nr:beta galactosidase jelly roll domain-containing protein [Bacteroidota bacterium]